MARVRASAARQKRSVGFSLSLVIVDTDDAAWKRAADIVEQVRANREPAGPPISGHTPPNDGSRRLLETVTGLRRDKCLWTGVAQLTGAAGNSTGLVGTPEQVADALLDYHALGIENFLIRGFEPLEDAERYGRELIRLVRERVAALNARANAAAA